MGWVINLEDVCAKTSWQGKTSQEISVFVDTEIRTSYLNEFFFMLFFDERDVRWILTKDS
jgi:hypothetical protein